MAADAHLRASFVLDTNLEEAVRKATEGLGHLEGQVAKSQDRLKKTIEKGDPLYALKKMQEREIAEVEKHIAKDARLRDLGELAKMQIVEKYAKKRQAIEENVSKSIERAQMAARENVGKLEQKFNAARGVMDAFGASSNTAIGQATSGLADLAQGFAAGGAAGLAVTGFTTLVFKLGEAWTNANSAAMKAKVTAATNWEDANAAVRAMIAQAQGDVLTRRDRLRGVSSEQMQGQAMIAAADEQVGAQASAKAAVEKQLADLDAQIKKAEARSAGARESDALAGGIRLSQLQGERSALVKHLEDANFQLKEARANADYARIAATELVGVLNDEKLDKAAKKAGSGSSGGGGKYGAAISAAAEQRRLDDEIARGIDFGSIKAAGNPYLLTPDEEAALGIKSGDKFGAGVTAMNEAMREQAEKDLGIGWGDIAKNSVKDKAATEAWAQAGVSAAGQFASAFKSFLESKDPSDLFKGLLGAAGGIIGAIGAATGGVGTILGGGALSILGGFFEKGGNPYAFHLPQGRNGLAVMPGLNFDAKPAWLHKGEVVMPEHVVNDTFGGLPNAMRIAAGQGAPASAQTIVINNTMAFDAPTIERNSARLEGVQQRRVTNRQASGWQESVRHAVMTPRFA